MIKKLCLIFLISINGAYACDVVLSSYTYTLDKIKISEIAQISKECKEADVRKLEDFINDYQGNLSAGYLHSILPEVNITPAKFSVISIKSYLKSLLENKTYKIGKVKLLHHKNFLNSDRPLKIVCERCGQSGEHQFKVGNSQIIWGKTEVLVQAPLLVARKNIQSFSNTLNGSDFELEKRWVLAPELYHFKKADLEFYKLSKPMRIGDVLNKSDLMAKNIVHMGKKVKVILQNKNVVIETQGISKSSGHIQDNVMVENIKTKKRYSAQVVGVNKVRIDL